MEQKHIETILTCPFCGNNPTLTENFPLEDLYTLSCENTLCRIHPYKVGKTTEECIIDWNRRVTAPSNKAATLQVEKLELKKERDAAISDLESVDKCDVCLNWILENDKYYDETDNEYYPRRYKCDSCFLGGGEHNNFEWRGLTENTEFYAGGE